MEDEIRDKYTGVLSPAYAAHARNTERKSVESVKFVPSDEIPDWVEQVIKNLDWFKGWHPGKSVSGIDEPDNVFYLDIAELVEKAEYNARVPSNAEFAQMTQGLTPDQTEAIANRFAEDYLKSASKTYFQTALRQLDERPLKTLEWFNNGLGSLIVNPTDDQYEEFRMPYFKLVNADRYASTIRELSLENFEGKLLQIRGWLTYIQNPPQERIVHAEWECTSCHNLTYGNRQPTYCVECGKSRKFTLDETTLIREKFQECLLTENFEDSTGYPTTLKITLSKQDTNQYSPGDRVTVVGILQAEEFKKKDETIVYNHAFEVMSVKKEDEKYVNMTSMDLKNIEDFANQGDALTRLADLYAPEIIGNEHVKKAIILQAAGSPEEEYGTLRKRGRIHLLLIGDPGTGKSQLLRAIPSLVKKSYYVTDASAAGLTAAVTDVNGKKVMQAGVLVIADNGVASIDELDKMKSDDREQMHNAMEQGEISKSKAGLHAHFQSRTSVLAAANPKLGKFDVERAIADQIDIEIPLLNRFDLIYIFIDKPASEEYEEAKARKILLGNPDAVRMSDPDFLLKYISVAKNLKPTLSPEVTDLIAKYFSQVRKRQSGSTINARTLESLKRLSIASARIRMSSETTAEDFEHAKELVDLYLQQFNFDLDAIGGVTKSIRDLTYAIRNIVGAHSIISKFDIYRQLDTDGTMRRKIDKALEVMYQKGMIFEVANDTFQLVDQRDGQGGL